jgi:hypothetical protein
MAEVLAFAPRRQEVPALRLVEQSHLDDAAVFAKTKLGAPM